MFPKGLTDSPVQVGRKRLPKEPNSQCGKLLLTVVVGGGGGCMVLQYLHFACPLLFQRSAYFELLYMNC
jgi:hypothetical protein